MAPDEMAGADGVVNGGPVMRVDRHGIANRVKNAHPLILEDQRVVFRCRDDGIQFGWPRPRFCHYLEKLCELVHGKSRFADQGSKRALGKLLMVGNR